MSDQYNDADLLNPTSVEWISGIDLHLKSAFTTELQNLKAREKSHTDQDIIVIKYLNNRIKEINKKRTA